MQQGRSGPGGFGFPRAETFLTVLTSASLSRAADLSALLQRPPVPVWKAPRPPGLTTSRLAYRIEIAESASDCFALFRKQTASK